MLHHRRRCGVNCWCWRDVHVHWCWRREHGRERACCTPPQVQVRRKLLERARCIPPPTLAPRSRLEQARCTHPLVLAQRTQLELAIGTLWTRVRCTPPLALALLGASQKNEPSKKTTLLDLCVGNLEPKWPQWELLR